MSLAWCMCSQCSLADGGRLLQAKKTRLRHSELDQRNEDHLAMLQARDTEDEPPAGSSISLASTHGRPALLQAKVATVLHGPALGGPNPLPKLQIDDDWGLDLQYTHDDGDLMDLDDKSSNDGNEHLILSSDDNEARNHDVLFPHDLEEELIIADDHISDDGGDLDAADDLVNDPAFHAANPLADDEDDVQQGDANPEDEDLFDEPPAFEEHSAIRNAYVRAYVAAAFKGATHEVCRIILDGVARALTSA